MGPDGPEERRSELEQFFDRQFDEIFRREQEADEWEDWQERGDEL